MPARRRSGGLPGDQEFERLAERALRLLRPDWSTEESVRRLYHRDIEDLPTPRLEWELRWLRIILASRAIRFEYFSGWYRERHDRIEAELARRERGGAR